MMRSPGEQAERKRFEALYVRAQSSVMLSIERSVCGCDYGGNSWTTQVEARRIAALLRVMPGWRLLEVGAGSGWPGLYLAQTSGCDVVLVDLPLTGLRIAADRAARDRLRGDCLVSVADAAELPFSDRSFDAISHSDLLCCLRHKRAVLQACRRVIRDGARMVFTVICVAPGLSDAETRRAVENGPMFIESETDYPTMLRETAWTIAECEDVTTQFAASCRRQLHADEERKSELESLIGAAEVAERMLGWRSKLIAIDDGLLRRYLFVAEPVRGGNQRAEGKVSGSGS